MSDPTHGPRFLLAVVVTLIVLVPAPARTAVTVPEPEPPPAPPTAPGRYDAPGVTLTRVGQPAPVFKVKTLDGATIDVAALKGKPLVMTFWATWCGPCQAELPDLEVAVWQKYRARGLAMVAIARRQSAEEIAAWRWKHTVTFPFAPDPDGEVYALFATEGIPRTYVIGADGRILFQSFGYDFADVGRVAKLVEAELAKKP